MATSGTVSQTVFKTRKIIDHAIRRCKLVPQQIAGEHIETANDLLFMFLSTLTNRGIPLWCIKKYILPMYRGQRSVPLPRGTTDVVSMNLRRLFRETGVNSASEGVANNAFDGDTDTDCTQVTPAGWIKVQYPTDEQPLINSYGILPAVSATWDITIQGSNDDVAWTNLYADAEFEAVAGEWLWIDIERQIPWKFIRLLGGAATVLDVAEFYLGGRANEIPMAKINVNSYTDLPDKMFLGRPTEYWFDKSASTTAGQNTMTTWPPPAVEFIFHQYVAYLKRHPMDVGAMTDELDVPQGWYMAIVNELARHLCREIKEADEKRIPLLDQDARDSLNDAWAAEDDGSPMRIQPKIGVYTR